MREQNGRSQEKELLVRGLKEKLNWYTTCASGEEFDEKAVASILYLLDDLEPLEEEVELKPEEAWGRFQMLVEEREEGNLSGTAEATEAEWLEKLEPAEVAEVLGKLGPAEVLGELESEEVLGKLEPTGVWGKLEPTGVLGKLEPVDPAEVLRELEPVEVAEDLRNLEPVKVAEDLRNLEPMEMAEVVGKLEGLDTSGNMVWSEVADISEMADVSRMAEKGRRSGKAKSTKGLKAARALEKGKETEVSEELGVPAKSAFGRKFVRADSVSASQRSHSLSENQKGAVLYNKYIVAAVLLLIVISMVGVIGNVQAGASPNTGFFHWLKRDNTGIQMITSPEDLNSKTDVQGLHTYLNSEDVPDWAQGWLEIDDEFEMPVNYEWDCYEVEEPRNFQKISSYYLDKTTNKEMVLGMIMYHGEISFNTEGLVDYEYVDSYETNQKEMNIYNRVEDTGEKCYIIYFYEGKCQYFMQGHDNLDELKGLMEKYWLYVKKNLKDNEIICNKILSQAIYK